MEVIYLTDEKYAKSILNRQISICYKFLEKNAALDCNGKALVACAVLFSQMVLQEVINRIAKDDDELDHFTASEALLLVAKLAAASIDSDGPVEVIRLQLRSKKLKGVVGFRTMQIWEIQYWLRLGLKLSSAEVDGLMPVILTWLKEATNEAFHALLKIPPLAMNDRVSEELDFSFLDLNAPNMSNGTKKK